MSVLILKNVRSEGPGTIEYFLKDNRMDFRVIECATEPVPADADFDTLIMMGGPMSVNETDLYPFVQREIDLAASSIKKGKRVFGVCLGAQIMAKALGAKVYPGAVKEIGWYDIELRESGLTDPLMTKAAIHPRTGDYRKRFKVFQWHGETFDVPEGAVRLAGSDLYPNQAFRYGTSAYAFQFHVEVTKEMIYEWLGSEPVDMEKLRRETDLYYDDCAGRAMSFYGEFFKALG